MVSNLVEMSLEFYGVGLCSLCSGAPLDLRFNRVGGLLVYRSSDFFDKVNDLKKHM